MAIDWSYSLADGGSPSGSGGIIDAFSGVPAPELLYSTVALDPVTGDVAVPIRILKGPLAVAQRVRCRFLFFLGEWFLDTRLGVPWYQRILIKGADLTSIEAIFRNVLRMTPGVASVKSMSSSLDTQLRKLRVDYEAILEDGSILRAQDEPFILPN